ncbi:MAG: hypothetical protein ABIH00_01735 [Armatimonadota bacterium]
MRGPDLTNLRSTLNRINQIQSMFDAEKSTQSNDVSFDAMLQGALNKSTGGSFAANQLLNNLSYINHLNNQTLVDLSDPKKMIKYKNYEMQAKTAARFQKLEYLVSKHFPGKEVIITSTTDGMHLDQNHYTGEAVDFVVDGITREESRQLEELCRQAGFKPYNEYLYGSRYKPGDHMHIDYVD